MSGPDKRIVTASVSIQSSRGRGSLRPCHCERSEAISFGSSNGRLLRRSTPRNDRDAEVPLDPERLPASRLQT